MAKVTFDGVNKLIIVNPGITELDVKIDIYSDWKEWALLTDNLKFEAALRAVGGDPISDTRSLGTTFFLINEWRIRPDEVDHRLLIEGNLFTEPAGFSPIVPTLGNFNVVVEYSVSNLVDATVSNIDVARTQYLIESVRGHHGSYGNVFFWNPVSGNDLNDGITPDSPVQHFSAAHDLVVSGRHDVIFLMTSAVEIEWDESLVITKRDVSVRGVGHGVIIKPTTAGVDAVTISAHGTHLQGLAISTVTGGDAIYVNGEFSLIEDCNIDGCSGNGIMVNGNASNSRLNENLIHNCVGDGIHILDSEHIEINDNDIHDCNDGIGVEATTPLEMHVDIYDNRISDCIEYGVSIGIGVQEISIGQHNVFSHNSLGDILDQGTNTYIDDTIVAERIGNQVWNTQVPTGTNAPAPGSYGELVQDSFSTLIAAIIAADLLVEVGSTDTVIKTGATQADSFYDGLVVVISNMAGTVARKVNLYNQADGTFTLDQALPFTPSVGDRFIVLGRIASATANIDNNAVAIAVWARSILAPTVGSYGELTNKIGNNTSVIPALL